VGLLFIVAAFTPEKTESVASNAAVKNPSRATDSLAFAVL
jgi:hypothetical protein